jgi:hypothetical protein
MEDSWGFLIQFTCLIYRLTHSIIIFFKYDSSYISTKYKRNYFPLPSAISDIVSHLIFVNLQGQSLRITSLEHFLNEANFSFVMVIIKICFFKKEFKFKS